MKLVRKARRGLIATAALSAVLVVAACGGGGGSAGGEASEATGADWTKQGDCEYWGGKDTSGNTQKLIDQFNAQHPNGKVTYHELPDSADQQRQQMIQNTQIKNPKMCVLSMDVVWTAEFAANQYVEAMPDGVSTEGMLRAAVDAATYFNKLYGLPSTSDGGLLYYRTDLLKKYDIAEPPKTFEEMWADCKKIQAGEDDPKLGCFAGQYNKYEGLTVNFDEAVHSAGGVIVGDDGKANVNTPEAINGLTTLVDGFKNGQIPKAAITWQEEEGRSAFQAGQLIFHRNWGYVYNRAESDKDSKVKGKFDVAVLPGITVVPGVSSLGGHTNAIAKYAEAKGTGLDYAKFIASPEAQKSNTLATSLSPVVESVYTDPEVAKKFPFMPIQLQSIQTAVPRPKAVAYGDVTLAIQDSVYAALQGQIPPDQAMQQLQTKLETLIK